jgi:G3E family GTPase
MIAARAAIPMTVVGGFLGAGKTTFLNQLLSQGKGRYAVLVNDFGAINVDAELIARHDGTTIALTNGCVCCSIGGGFIEALGGVLDMEATFDRIIVEVSGVGDPWRIAEIALVEPGLRPEATIVLADAARIEKLLTDAQVGATVRSQFERCGVVLLNKVDLVDRSTLDAARAAVEAICNGVRIVETSQAMMPDISSLCRPSLASSFYAQSCTDDLSDHENTFRRWFYQRAGAFDRDLLAQAIVKLPSELLRLKGTCGLAGEAGRALLQVTGPTWTLTDAEPEGGSGIVLTGIGTQSLPDAAELDSILDQALANTAS